jgi:hypothetical protein
MLTALNQARTVELQCRRHPRAGVKEDDFDAPVEESSARMAAFFTEQLRQ